MRSALKRQFATLCHYPKAASCTHRPKYLANLLTPERNRNAWRERKSAARRARRKILGHKSTASGSFSISTLSTVHPLLDCSWLLFYENFAPFPHYNTNMLVSVWCSSLLSQYLCCPLPWFWYQPPYHWSQLIITQNKWTDPHIIRCSRAAEQQFINQIRGLRCFLCLPLAVSSCAGSTQNTNRKLTLHNPTFAAQCAQRAD